MLYPLTFKPILKEVIWGGSDICPFKGITPERTGIGESWEVSHVEGHYSVVANGPLEDKTLEELIDSYGPQLVGSKVQKRFGHRFPLLIKFIDARDNLSIQVHPNDELAEKRHHSFGKTEMWYVIKTAPGAALYSGFSQQIDADEYVRRVGDNTLMDVLKKYLVKPGDVFFLPAGRVHAIGSGCFIAEIQQTSDITYRIYDYNRKDANGNTRELHTGLAKDAIDYTFHSDYQTHYTPVRNQSVDLVSCKYFTTNLLDLDAPVVSDFSALDSFVIYICMEGKALIEDNAGQKVSVHQGQTVLIPAETKTVSVTPVPSAKLLETYISV
ncbi:type I phosphomannose isomerase catalytic subunit [Parabacteroides sp. Marseille-P3160]|uniref:type I phosphomannose isomerase catalytic subunit n=1 Tax=Parabacteroides sp. Marseille-P3160 TaxID=1917887 RepID=UPI0009B938BD|nr:type I phosphomannose isomerase catalytic subunit [Parabacteroides sp. Marseille-P3160]